MFGWLHNLSLNDAPSPLGVANPSFRLDGPTIDDVKKFGGSNARI